MNSSCRRPPRPNPRPPRARWNPARPSRTLEENLADLPRACDVGTKRGAKGRTISWAGYKFHLSTVDGDVPVSAILSSASMHDSQAAIPLMQMTAKRLKDLYDLFDSACDARLIAAFSRLLGHVPIIDANPRRGAPPPPMDPATAARYGQRSSAERVNSDLKDNHGGRFVRVRGAAKVMAHLMFGVIVIAAKQLFAMRE